jgi:hypothetical protein
MLAIDASRLLIAILATDTATDAGPTVKTFGTLTTAPDITRKVQDSGGRAKWPKQNQIWPLGSVHKFEDALAYLLTKFGDREYQRLLDPRLPIEVGMPEVYVAVRVNLMHGKIQLANLDFTYVHASLVERQSVDGDTPESVSRWRALTTQWLSDSEKYDGGLGVIRSFGTTELLKMVKLFG